VSISVANALVAKATSTGLAVTGALSATGALTTAGIKEVAGNVGIGTSSPATALDIAAYENPILRLRSLYDGTPTTWTTKPLGGIEWYTADPSGNGPHIGASIRGVNNNPTFDARTTPSYELIFSTSPTNTVEVERLRIDSSGIVLLGKTTATANGGDLQVSRGITFPATQVACSDANTLDDYEEGTWTPNVYPAGGSWPTFTSSGRYTKVGNTIIAYAVVTFTSSNGSGYINLNTFPFPAGSAEVLKGHAVERTTGVKLSLIPGSTAVARITKYDGTYYEASGYVYDICLTYAI